METLTITEPMQSAKISSDTDFDKIRWPVYASPKLDGIRCLLLPTKGAVSRSFLPIPNHHIRNTLHYYANWGPLDGELIVLDEHGDTLPFNDIQSAVMSQAGEPNFRYLVFDYPMWDLGYGIRYLQMLDQIHCLKRKCKHFEAVRHVLVRRKKEFLEFYGTCLEGGYEGAMIRAVDGPWKNGRSTLNQNWSVKLKPVEDAEGTIVGFEEGMHNINENVGDQFGRAKRSTAKKGMIPNGRLGKFILHTEWGELRVGTGTGLTHALRQEIWDNQIEYLGKRVTFKYQKEGSKVKPRFPIYKGIRHD